MYIITSGASHEIIIPIANNDVAVDMTTAVEIRAVAIQNNAVSPTARWSNSGTAGYGICDIALPSTNNLRLYAEYAQTVNMSAGVLEVEITASFVDAVFPSGYRVEKWRHYVGTVFRTSTQESIV